MTKQSIPSLRDMFASTVLAGSEVTEREAGGDKSVTLVQYEKSVLHRKIPPENIARRGVVATTGNDRHDFFLLTDPVTMSYEKVKLPLVYPKKSGSELRLYFSRSANFYPSSGQYWFVACPDELDAPLVGILTADQWLAITSTSENIALENHLFSNNSDETDSDYQRSINDPRLLNIVGYTPLHQKALTQIERAATTQFSRDPRLARWHMKQTGFKCEMDPDHSTFVNGSTGEQYMEAHHLVPISRSPDMGGEWSLDIPSNILCLCPTCHRAFHHGSKETKQDFLGRAWQMRRRDLAAAGLEITQERLYEFYRAG